MALAAREKERRRAGKLLASVVACRYCLSRRCIPPIVLSSLQSNQDQAKGGENENKVLRRASRIRARDQHG